MPRFDYQLSPRDVEEEVVLRYTNNAYKRLDDIPLVKVESILKEEANRQGGEIDRRLVDGIVKSEKKAIDNAVKDIRNRYGYSVGQVAVNDFYKRFYNVMSRKFKDAAFRLAGVRMGLKGENMRRYRYRGVRFEDNEAEFLRWWNNDREALALEEKVSASRRKLTPYINQLGGAIDEQARLVKKMLDLLNKHKSPGSSYQYLKNKYESQYNAYYKMWEYLLKITQVK